MSAVAEATATTSSVCSELLPLQELVADRRHELGVPGVAVAVVHGDHDDVICSGVGSIDAPAPITPETLFMIGSTTKVVTATAALALVDAGVLALDEPIARHWTGGAAPLPAAAKESLTLRHLLTHSGGFEGDVGDDDEDWAADALARNVDAFPGLAQHAAPGEAFSYSNSGLRLVGRLLEIVTGERYDVVVRRLVLDPLGMASSRLLPWQVLPFPHAVGHLNEDGATRVARTWGLGRAALPEGGLVSSVADQARFARFHLTGTSHGAGIPVTEPTRLEMQQSQLDAAPPFDAVGLPWLLVRTHGITTVTHGGNIAGVQLSSLSLMPEHGVAVTCLTNVAAGRALGSEVNQWCLETLLGLRPAPSPAVPQASAEAVGRVTGRYDCGTWGLHLEVVDAQLRARFFLRDDVSKDAAVPPPMPLELGQDDAVRIAGGGPLFGRLQRDAHGSVVRLLCQGRATRRA